MGRVTQTYLNVVLETDCFYCGKFVPKELRTRDHIIPKSKGGSSEGYNLVMACHHCNHNKSSNSIQWFLEHNIPKKRRNTIIAAIDQRLSPFGVKII